MLVISRREGESIHIGDNIVVTIVRISGNKIRLGFESKEDLSILRSELVEKDQTPRFLEFELPEETNLPGLMRRVG